MPQLPVPPLVVSRPVEGPRSRGAGPHVLGPSARMNALADRELVGDGGAEPRASATLVRAEFMTDKARRDTVNL